MNTLYSSVAIKKKSKKVCQKGLKAFTLIELLVVIAVIGILAAVIFLGTQSSTANARDGRRQSELSQTKKALQAYYLQNGRYPTTSVDGISLESDSDTNGTFSQTMKAGGYMSIIPRDPKYAASAGDYAYKYIATSTNAFILCAKTEVSVGYACTDQTSGGGIAFSDEPPVDFGGWGGGGGGFACGDVLTDSRDGKTYSTVQIGTQCWFGQNLNVGAMVNSTVDQGTSCSSIQKYCGGNWIGNCTRNVSLQYDGGYYQWDQAMCGATAEGAQGICPTGWHIPSNHDQFILENYLKDTPSTPCDEFGSSGCSSAGTKLQSSGTPFFYGLRPGDRIADGTFENRGGDGFYLSSTADGADNVWVRLLDAGNDVVYRSSYSKLLGMSVRCVKD